MPEPATVRRSAGLDLIRIAAAFAVFTFHLEVTVGGTVLVHGNLAVPAFFALSGYLVYGPFTRRVVPVRGYLARRAGRIVPAAVVALVAIGQAMPHDAFRGFVVVCWSLLIEGAFYLILPLLARLARGRELGVIGALGGASWIAAVALRPEPSTVNALAVAPLFFWCFAAGMLIAVLERDHRDLLERLPLLPAGAILAFAALLVPGAVAMDPLPAIATAALIGGLVVHPIRSSATVGLAAEASYPFYLWHASCISLIAPLSGGPALAITAFALAAAASLASVLLVERPIRGLLSGGVPDSLAGGEQREGARRRRPLSERV